VAFAAIEASVNDGSLLACQALAYLDLFIELIYFFTVPNLGLSDVVISTLKSLFQVLDLTFSVLQIPHSFLYLYSKRCYLVLLFLDIALLLVLDILNIDLKLLFYLGLLITLVIPRCDS
jgi:hypothetical protein